MYAPSKADKDLWRKLAGLPGWPHPSHLNFSGSKVLLTRIMNVASQPMIARVDLWSVTQCLKQDVEAVTSLKKMADSAVILAQDVGVEPNRMPLGVPA